MFSVLSDKRLIYISDPQLQCISGHVRHIKQTQCNERDVLTLMVFQLKIKTSIADMKTGEKVVILHTMHEFLITISFKQRNIRFLPQQRDRDMY